MNITHEDLQEFQVEARELLQQAESNLLQLDKGGDFKTLYDSVFRVIHSLKGGAGMFGLLELQKHLHSLETTLTGHKSKNQLESSETFVIGI